MRTNKKAGEIESVVVLSGPRTRGKVDAVVP